MNSIEELIKEFERIKSLGYVQTVVDNSINGGGLTLEKLLGKEIDNLYTPDYKGIELKTKSRFSHFPLKLFAYAFAGPKEHESLDIASLYGYKNSYSYFLKVLLKYNKLVYFNKHYFELTSDNEKFYINIYNHKKNLIEKRGYIYFDDLIKRAEFKLNEMALIRYSKKSFNNIMHYRYYKLTYYKLKKENLINLIKENKLSFLIHLYFYKVNGMYENRSKNIELQLHEEAIPALFESIKEIEWWILIK